MRLDLDAVLRCACDAALAAGRTLASRLGDAGRIRLKPTGPVTDSDVRAERAALAIIRRAFPDHAVLSEEEGAAGAGHSRWIVDPLDGTVNFIHGIPWYDVSIAYEHRGHVVVGVVYAPSLDLLFTCVRRQGTRLNGRPVRSSTRRTLAGSLVDTGLQHDDWANDRIVGGLAGLSAAGVNVRSMNACGVDLAYVSAGWIEGYFDAQVSLWDLAAGSLLVREAGGRVTTWTNHSAADGASIILASNAHLHGRLLRLFGPGRGGAGVKPGRFGKPKG